MSFCGFQRRLSDAKAASGLCDQQIADACRVERKAVIRWRMGESLPNAERLYNHCEVFGVSADWLLGCDAYLGR